jgi:hypothetical protein
MMRFFRLERHNLLDPPSVLQALQPFSTLLKIRDASGHFQNASDTLVVKLNSLKDVTTAVEITKAMKDLGCDEINVKSCERGMYIRFWWD